ncbi:anhydro-N-acetylmuramic acid kinase [Bryobacter aggregatus]|uniref:anhydro-N-acetylmuramic acid kinase n=1 Tax=Bryobacter aggregatus TaxID=360054 RepID=UPI000690ABB0|nr:anhydro-N-acetylmuramic acid kinase [Bryobacter aggregatus]
MRVAGVMSGTSLDGIDVAVVDIDWPKFEVVKFASTPYTKTLRKKILAVSNTDCHTRDIARLHYELAECYAAAIAALGVPDIDLIGCHGQTVYHEGPRCTLQLGEGAVIAERLGIETITNFRARDLAAGGHGAPLVPFFDWMMLTRPEIHRVAINIGGIANVHALPAGAAATEVFAFDTGPGNMVIDQLTVIATNGKQQYDRDAVLGRKGKLDHRLLRRLLRDPYFRKAPPKSAGREQYGEDFVAKLIETGLPLVDLIATATAFTAASIAEGITRFIVPHFAPDECLVSGGGVHNPLLMAELQGLLPTTYVHSIDDIGIPADAKEAIAFAVLAAATKLGIPSNLPSATGARHAAVLGQLHPR